MAQEAQKRYILGTTEPQLDPELGSLLKVQEKLGRGWSRGVTFCLGKAVQKIIQSIYVVQSLPLESSISHGRLVFANAVEVAWGLARRSTSSRPIEAAP